MQPLDTQQPMMGFCVTAEKALALNYTPNSLIRQLHLLLQLARVVVVDGAPDAHAPLQTPCYDLPQTLP